MMAEHSRWLLHNLVIMESDAEMSQWPDWPQSVERKCIYFFHEDRFDICQRVFVIVHMCLSSTCYTAVWKKPVKAVHEVFWQVSYPAPEETEVYFSARNEVSPLGQEFMVVSELVVDESSTAGFRSYFPPFNAGTRANAHRRAHGHTLIAVRGSCSRTDGHLSDRCKHGRDTN